MKFARRGFLPLLLVLPALLSSQPLPERIESVVRSSITARHGHWGIHVLDLSTGQSLYAWQEDQFFVPASTTKLFSTAMALHRLGPDYRFRTAVFAPRKPENGLLRGDLRLAGGGDPTLSGRAYPYRRDAPAGNPLQAIEDLSDALARQGIARIEGDIIGDDTAYEWEPFPEGRAQEDFLWEFGAPVSALTVNDSRIALVVRPGRRAGDPAQIRLTPSFDYFLVENRVVTTAAGTPKLQVARAPGSRQLRLWGTMPLRGPAEGRSLAVDDPALFAAAALRDALIRRGVAVTGRPQARHRYPGETLLPAEPSPAAGDVRLAERLSPPLADILTVVNKESVNLHAELLLAETGRARRGVGSRAAGLAELESFLREANVPDGDARLYDASGLSMLNMTTPRALTSLLSWMERSPLRDAFRDSLPVAGEEGTLRNRFRGLPEARWLRAKTGSLSRVIAIAGYAGSPSGIRAFAILVNNYAVPAAEVRAIVDKICMLLLD